LIVKADFLQAFKFLANFHHIAGIQLAFTQGVSGKHHLIPVGNHRHFRIFTNRSRIQAGGSADTLYETP
jgi:hypothetical protein